VVGELAIFEVLKDTVEDLSSAIEEENVVMTLPA